MNGKLIVPALVLCAVAIGGPAASQQSPSWAKPIAPFKIIDNTYWVGTEGLAAYLITTPRGHFLLDVGLPENADIVEKNIATLGFKLSDVKFLLNSHAHFDHSGGLATLKADTGAIVISSEGDRAALEKGVYPGSEDVAALKFPPVIVDRVVVDGDQIELGGVTLTAHITPGHTKGCTSWTWPVKDMGVTHTAVDFCSASVAANRLAPRPQYPGIVDDYRKTFAKVKTIKADVFLAPHAEFFGLAAKRDRIVEGKPSPFIDANAFHAFVAGQEKAFETTLAAQMKSK